jgi:hypothetical protein
MRLIGFAAILSCLWAAGAAALPVSPPAHDAVTPDVAVNARGDIAVLWVDQAPERRADAPGRDTRLSYVDLYVAVSRDGGASFAAPVKVNRRDGLVRALGVNRPRIVAAPSGTWHVSFAANEIHPALDKPLLSTHYTRSTDGGASFAPSVRLSPLVDADQSGSVHIHGGYMSAAAFGTLAAAADGRVAVLWIDSRHMTPGRDVRALYMAASADSGGSFAAPTMLLPTDVCPCCQMMAAADAAGGIAISLRMVAADGARQASIARLAPGAAALAAPVDTGGARWVIDGCPLKPAAVAVRGETVYTAVYNGAETPPGVYVAVSHDGGRSFGPAAAAHPEATVSDAPALAVNDRFALLAWHGKTDGPRRVFTRMYDRDGRPAGGIAALPTGAENAQTPVVAARPDGRFQIAWQQGGRIHTAVLPAAPGDAAADGAPPRPQ